MPAFFVTGLDLGEASDYTALSIIEVTPQRQVVEVVAPDPSFANVLRPRGMTFDAPPAHLAVRWLERYELGTTYPQIVQQVATRLSKVPGGTLLAVDATGVGRAIVDMFRVLTVPLAAITITGGAVARPSDAPGSQEVDWNVPKRDLAHGLLAAFQERRFAVAPNLPLADTLKAELGTFQVKLDPKTGHDSYESWRESDHDDLVLSVAIAAWLAEREVHARAAAALREIQALRYGNVTGVQIGAQL